MVSLYLRPADSSVFIRLIRRFVWFVSQTYRLSGFTHITHTSRETTGHSSAGHQLQPNDYLFLSAASNIQSWSRLRVTFLSHLGREPYQLWRIVTAAFCYWRDPCCLWQEDVQADEAMMMSYRNMFTLHLFCHLCVSLTASSLVICMRVLLPFPRRWSLNLWQSPHITACLPSSPFFCCAFFKSTGDTMKGHVYRSSQHLASALTWSLLLLLATEAGTTATKRVRHSPQRCGRSGDSQAKHCPGFTAWRSTLQYTLTSLST